MKLSVTAALLLAILLVASGWLLGDYVSRDIGAVARVDSLVDRSRRDDAVSHTRDTLYLPRLVRARAQTDTLLQRDTLLRADTVRLMVAMERAACDTLIAAKDSTIRETRELRDDAIREAARLARRGPSRLALSFQVTVPEARPQVSLSYRLTRVLGLDVNVGLAYQPR